MSDFQWRTDEDDGRWDTPPSERRPDPLPGRKRRWRRLLFLAVIVLLGAGAAALVYRRAAEEVAATQAQIAADVVSGYEVVRRAAESRDRELFTSVLSGRDDAWTAAMQDTVEEGGLFDRPVLGLRVLALPTITTDTVRLADDLQAAEVQVPVQYALDAGNGVTATVTLSQTHLYRRGNNQRWLFAPPVDDFWGSRAEIRGRRLTAAFPARDRQLLERLVVDLDRKLQEACALPDVVCDDGLRLSAIFDTEPTALRAGAEPETWFQQPPPLRLPTPTLVGLPQDAIGYGALLRGYGALLVRRLLTDAAGYECCEAALFTQALLDYQLDQLSLRPWPLGQEEFARLAGDLEALESPLSASRMVAFDWIYEGEAWIRAYATMQFLIETTPETSAGKLQQLSTRERDQLLAERDLIRWLAFIGDGTRPAVGTDAQAIPWTLNTVCGATFDPDILPPSRLTYHTYTPATGIVETRELPFEPGIGIPIPGGRSLLLVSGSDETFLYVPDLEAAPVPVQRPEGYTGTPIFAQVVPGLSRANLFYANEQDGVMATLDLDRCDEGACAATSVPVYPRWSPSGNLGVTTGHAFFEPADGTYLIDRQGAIIREIGRSGQPPYYGTWIDEERFAYVSDGTVYLESVGDDEPQLLFTGDEVVLDPDEPAIGDRQFMTLQAAAGDLFAALLIDRGGSAGSAALILRYNPEKGTLTELLRDEHAIFHLSTSPDHRQLLAGHANDSTFSLIDLETNEIRRWGVSDPIPLEQAYWSPDSRWLLLPGNSTTRLFDTETGAYRLLPYGNADGCLRSAWSRQP